MNQCKGVLGILLGHKFRPRYSEGNPFWDNIETRRIEAIPAILNASKSRTYVQDVCERCGETTQIKPKAST